MEFRRQLPHNFAMHHRRQKTSPNTRLNMGLILLVLTLGAGASIIWLALKAGRAGANQLVSHGANTPSQVSQTDSYADYGGLESCRECHETEYNQWKFSHHGLAERKPLPAMDDAAFIPARSFVIGTQKTSVFSTNGHYELITTGLHGSHETFAVERILADSPLRQMLIPFPGGRLQATEVAWDPRSNQWFDVYGNEDRKPGEWGHWTGRGMNWNSMCAVCHNTRLRKNYDAASDTYHTTMAENGVGCESCHGPMKDHNVWQRAHKGQSLPDPT